MKTLHQIVGARHAATAVEKASGNGEVLYRMVLPKEMAKALSAGSAKIMTAKGGEGIRGSIVSGGRIAGHAKFVRVAAASGAGGAAGGAVVATTGTAAAAMVAAAPMLVLLAATAAGVHAEEQRRQALVRLEESLDALNQAMLDDERDRLQGATPAIAKATALLADEGRLGMTLGIDSAVYAIDTALATAERRIGEWEQSLQQLGASATPAVLERAFPGVQPGRETGDFIAKLRMTVFAIAMKRRITVLQAAEHTQLNPELSLGRFVSTLARDGAALDELERRLTDLLDGLASVQLEAPDKVRDVMFRRPEVRRLLEWSPRLRQLALTESPQIAAQGDVELSVIVSSDGTGRVLAPVTMTT